MKNLLTIVFGSLLLSSCYAFLQADKLIYAGTVAKRPVTVSVDSLFQTEVEVNSSDSFK